MYVKLEVKITAILLFNCKHHCPCLIPVQCMVFFNFTNGGNITKPDRVQYSVEQCIVYSISMDAVLRFILKNTYLKVLIL